MGGHKTELGKHHNRESVERVLLTRHPAKLDIFKPLVDYPVVDRFKDGSYGMSNAGFAIYSNGHNTRGTSTFAPFGLRYNDGESIFSVGYFRREGDPPDKPGYLIIVSPRGQDSIKKVMDFVDSVTQSGLVSGVYVRYLKLEQYLKLLKNGWLPAKEHPWHPEAPEEDENLSNGLISLRNIVDNVGDIKNLAEGGNKNHRRNFRLHCNRFRHFIERNGLHYFLRKLDNSSQNDREMALKIVSAHFALLRKLGKAIGSTTEDHINSLSEELLFVPSIDARIGFLGEMPVSLFVYEKLTDARVGLYTTFTSRDKERVLAELNPPVDEQGFSGMPMYAYGVLFRQLLEEGITEAHLGGSEHPDLNLIKRHMGGQPDPTYWAVKLNGG